MKKITDSDPKITLISSLRSSFHPDMTELGQEYNTLKNFVEAARKALQNFRNNRKIKRYELPWRLDSSSVNISKKKFQTYGGSKPPDPFGDTPVSELLFKLFSKIPVFQIINF